MPKIAAVAGEAAEPTFDNTVAALERSGRVLSRVSNAFYVLAGAHTSEAIQAIEPPAQISQPVPLISQIATRFPLSDEGRSDDLHTPAKSQEGLAAIGH